MALVKAIHITRLGGFTGSNPEFLAGYPDSKLDSAAKQTVIDKSLPAGVQPNSFSLVKVGKEYYLSYIFSINSESAETRGDLASISVIMDQKQVLIDDFKILFKHIFDIMLNQTELLITAEFLMESLEEIFKGINKNQRVKIGKVVVDIPKIIKKEKLKVEKKVVVKGRFM